MPNHTCAYSAGFAGGFLEGQLETRGVRSEDIVVITLPTHTLVA